MAASDLTLPATVATELAGGVVAGDARLPRLIAVASSAIARRLNRQLHYAAAFQEAVPGLGRPRLMLSLTPVLTVASVLLDGTAVDPTTYAIEDAEAGFLYRQAGWAWTGQNRGGLPPQNDPLMGSERAAYALTYAGGYVTPDQAASVGWSGPARSLPYELEEACIQTVVALYRGNGRDPEVGSEQLGDYAVSYRNPNALTGGIIPDKVLPLIDPFARPV